MHRESSSSEDEGETPEQELQALRITLRQTKKTRKGYRQEMENELVKQREQILDLEREQAEMQKDLALAGSRKIESRDTMAVKEMAKLQCKEEQLKSMVAEEEELTAKLTSQLQDIEKMARQQHRNMGGVHKQQEKHVTIKKHIRVTENKLSTVTQDYNSLLSKNQVMRTAIDHFASEKKTFEKVRQRLQKELNETIDSLDNVVKMSTEAYEVKDDALIKAKNFKDRTEKEFANFSTELRELMRSLDHDRELKEFMTVKDIERVQTTALGEGDPSLKSKEPVVIGADIVAQFDAAVEHMRELTGISDVSKLVARFLQVEDESFGLFNYINTHGAMQESLKGEIAVIHEEMEAFRQNSVALDAERKRLMAELEKEHLYSVEERDEMEARIGRYQGMMNDLMIGVASLFNKTGCDAAPINDMLGGQLGVTNTSVLQYLGVIEERCSALLKLKSFSVEKDVIDAMELIRMQTIQEDEIEAALEEAKTNMPLPLMLTSIPRASPVHFHIDPVVRNTLDDSFLTSGSDDEAPIDINELRTKMSCEAAKKEIMAKEKKRDELLLEAEELGTLGSRPNSHTPHSTPSIPIRR